jgi:alpha-galactosidase
MAAKKPRSKSAHEAHSSAADSQADLPGRFSRPIKLTLLGAGSGFTPILINDLLQIPAADHGEIALVDIDRSRLTTMKRVVERLIAEHNKRGWTVCASPNRRALMPNSTYIVNCIEVSGLKCVGFDNDIPLKYGVDQCIGDTIGPGGLFKSLRTIPVWIQILRDAEEICPKALILNYTNPMNMMCMAAGRTSPMQVVGLCHSVQGSSHQLASRVGVPYEEMDWECAGINHLAWFTRLEHKGRDLYPRLMKQARAEVHGNREESSNKNRKDIGLDLVRKDMMQHFGAYITESSGHLSEYLPYYRTSRTNIRRYCGKMYNGESSVYRNNWPKWRAEADRMRMQMVKGTRPVVAPRSWEYASWIIEAREKDSPVRIHGNVMNTHSGGGPLISNLAHDGCVEVACMIDRNGVNPTCYGSLPPQMAAICQSNMNVFELGTTAALEKNKEAAIHALMLDPLTSACCTPDQIKAMALELFEAEKQFLKGYR